MLRLSSLLFVLGSCALFGQTAALRGVVSDESGAVVPGARVTLVGPEGLVKTAVADETGSYAFAALPAGSYAVQASAPNLAQAQAVKVVLRAGVQTVNLTLRVAGLLEKVTVQENGAPAVSTDAATNANAVVLRGDDLDALGDDPEDLLADLQALAGPSAGPSGGSIFIDGFSGGELPPKSAIREIRINQNPFSPEYDRLGFGRIEIFTKPGSDNWRASINYKATWRATGGPAEGQRRKARNYKMIAHLGKNLRFSQAATAHLGAASSLLCRCGSGYQKFSGRYRGIHISILGKTDVLPKRMIVL
jgi:hypothetical protein